jgi:broad specificity phosphatase PhoE
MEIININNYPIIFDDRIKERDCGEFTGKGFDSLDRDLYWNYYDETKYESAESIPHFFGRVFSLDYNHIEETYNLFMEQIFPNFKSLIDEIK